jgi:hypothetical protein
MRWAGPESAVDLKSLGTAHDFNSMLVPVTGYGELALQRDTARAFGPTPVQPKPARNCPELPAN